MITKFKIYENYIDIEHYNYLTLEGLDNGDLKISLTKEGKDEVDDYGIDPWKFYDYFEDIQGNSDYMYTEDIGELIISNGSFMTSAPAIIDGIEYKGLPNDHYELYDDSVVYVYYDYAIKDFTEELKNNGYVIFNTITPRTPEEIKQHKFKKDTKKYNL